MVSAILIPRDSSNPDNSYGSSLIRYEIAVGAVSVFVSLLVLLLDGFGLFKLAGVSKLIIGAFQFLWWIAAFIVLTYFGSFTSPTNPNAIYANGFFFTWAGLIFAALAFVEGLRGSVSGSSSILSSRIGLLVIIAVGSLIEMGAAISWYYNPVTAQFVALVRYALALGPVSVFLVLVMFCISMATRSSDDMHDSLFNLGLLLLTIWWALGLLILTFDRLWPIAIDNGYFSVYFTFGACLFALSGLLDTKGPRQD